MKNPISHTVPIRFPDAREMMYTSLPREAYVIRVLCAVLTILSVSYVTLVSMSIVNVIARKEAQDAIVETRSAIAQLEHDYFARVESLSLAHALERGLEPVTEKRFVQHMTAVGAAAPDRNGL